MKSLKKRVKALELRLASLLKESPITEKEEQMLECTGGEWYLDAFAEALYSGNSTDDCRIIGTEHETEAEAIEAGKRRIQQEIINNHATRLNKKDEFVVDWENYDQTKCYIVFCHYQNKWIFHSWQNIELTGNVAMSANSAMYLHEKLNKGLITGVNANGDI